MQFFFAAMAVNPAVQVTPDYNTGDQPYGGPFVEIVYIEGSNSNSNSIQGTTL